MLLCACAFHTPLAHTSFSLFDIHILHRRNEERFTNETFSQAREQRRSMRAEQPLENLPIGGVGSSTEGHNITQARTFEQRPHRAPTGPVHKLFVSNLSWTVDSKLLQQQFAAHGSSRAHVIKDRVKDRSRGYGFVEFDNEEKMLAALQAMQQKQLDGRTIIVKRAVEQPSFSTSPVAVVKAALEGAELDSKPAA